MVLLQFDFSADGPWGDQLTAACTGLAKVIGETPGLLWKIWNENPETREVGGVYLFSDEASAKSYLEQHMARLRSMGFANIRAKLFYVNEALSRMNRAPIEPSAFRAAS
jgi:hypothetical protein